MKYDLDPQDVQTIVNALGNLPLVQALPTYQKLMDQHNALLEKAQADARAAKQALDEQRSSATFSLVHDFGVTE